MCYIKEVIWWYLCKILSVTYILTHSVYRNILKVLNYGLNYHQNADCLPIPLMYHMLVYILCSDCARPVYNKMYFGNQGTHNSLIVTCQNGFHGNQNYITCQLQNREVQYQITKKLSRKLCFSSSGKLQVVWTLLRRVSKFAHFITSTSFLPQIRKKQAWLKLLWVVFHLGHLSERHLVLWWIISCWGSVVPQADSSIRLHLYVCVYVCMLRNGSMFFNPLCSLIASML